MSLQRRRRLTKLSRQNWYVCRTFFCHSKASFPNDRLATKILFSILQMADGGYGCSAGDSDTPSQGNSFGRVISRSVGTPLLPSKSGHSRLPPPENFSKDICDVINFENLPESTGKFETMRALLRKVKGILKGQRNVAV